LKNYREGWILIASADRNHSDFRLFNRGGNCPLYSGQASPWEKTVNPRQGPHLAGPCLALRLQQYADRKEMKQSFTIFLHWEKLCNTMLENEGGIF
jgi:hypothetical protein